MKFLYLLVALCALLAGVLGSPALPAEGEQVLSRSARETCNLRACEQFCKRLGYPGGACINNGTKCDCDRW